MATGVIKATFLSGGVIRRDGGGSFINFCWRHCDSSILPEKCGHDTPYEFDTIWLAGSEYARHVTRQRQIGRYEPIIGTTGTKESKKFAETKPVTNPAPRAPRGYANVRGRY